MLLSSVIITIADCTRCITITHSIYMYRLSSPIVHVKCRTHVCSNEWVHVCLCQISRLNLVSFSQCLAFSIPKEDGDFFCLTTYVAVKKISYTMYNIHIDIVKRTQNHDWWLNRSLLLRVGKVTAENIISLLLVTIQGKKKQYSSLFVS